MAEFLFQTSETVDRPIGEVFEFFSNAENLERITPPELNFHIVTPTPIVISEGTIIDYKLTLHGFPMTWRSEITLWEPPYRFADTQLKGPYKQWVHTHTFTEADGGTLMTDEVRYRLPFEPLGDIAQFLIDRQLRYIFKHRQRAVVELLG
jgi:ligand-binding SRPBCC domain-containing protein